MDDTIPMRLQRTRHHVWQIPRGGLVVAFVGRGSKWANPFETGEELRNELQARGSFLPPGKVERFTYDGVEGELVGERTTVDDVRRELRGKHLACWCRLCPDHATGKLLGVRCAACDPCHADVLLEFANGGYDPTKPKYLRLEEVSALSGMTPAEIKYEMEASGFPKPFRPSPRVRLWDRAEVQAYMRRVMVNVAESDGPRRMVSKPLEVRMSVTPPPPSESVVYFIRSGRLVKIGHSVDVVKRMRSLAGASATALELIDWLPGTTVDEARLHSRFGHLRAHGEWFALKAELRRFLKERGTI